MLEGLRRLYARNGFINSIEIEDDPDLPAVHTLRVRFGSLLKAYRAAGFPEHTAYELREQARHRRMARAASSHGEGSV